MLDAAGRRQQDIAKAMNASCKFSDFDEGFKKHLDSE